jgi:hypothetical protein
MSTGKKSCDVVYLILSHTNPEQVLRLVNRLVVQNEGAFVVVHHDYTRSKLDVSRLGARTEVLRHTQGIGWGSFELLLATLRSISWIDEHLDYRWIVFISGQDYPLLPPQQIQEFLLASDHDAFIAKPRPVDYRFRDEWGGRDFWSARYFYRYYSLPRLAHPLPRTIAKAVRNIETRIKTSQSLVFFWPMPGPRTSLGIRRLRHPFDKDFNCYCGSQWFTLSKKSVRVVLEFANERVDVLAYYKRTILPDESFFNSLLMSRSDLDVRLESLRYLRMAPPWYAHPDVLCLADFDMLIASGQHFARKFDPSVDTRILDEVDRHIDAQ